MVTLPWPRMVPHRRSTPELLKPVQPLLPAAAILFLAATAAPAQTSSVVRPGIGVRPTVVRTVPPEPGPNPALEAALREVLFPVRIDDGQGHGPDPDSVEGRQAKRFRIKVACERLPAHRYLWSRVDLNGDGRPELVAQVVGPMFCGTGGCPLLIFREPSPGRLQLVTQMGLFKDPLVVTERRHNGWRELITRVRIDAASGYYALLRHDGRSYPTNPSVPPAVPLGDPVPGTAYLAWNEPDPRAHALPCGDGSVLRAR